MASLDVDPLFNNIPLEETNKKSFFIFNNKFYEQVDGVATGSFLRLQPLS